MNEALKRFQDWFARPFREDMNVLDWALFVGLLLVLLVLWRNVLQRIID